MTERGDDMAPAFPVRKVLLCVSGGVSAALMPSWCVWARQRYDVDIRVVLTPKARTFVAPRALSAVTGNDVVCDEPGDTTSGKAIHLLLARWAEVAIVAPATGNTIAKLSHGIADNVLCTTLLSCGCPVVVAPSMSPTLFAAPSTRRNLALLAEDGWGVVPMVEGPGVADWSAAAGAMPDAPAVFEYTRAFVARHDAERAINR
jgi:phosphopantothenoylcysteine decarboxylase/phosphopantothenate--cysteine ligase